MKVYQYIQLTGETVRNENKLQLILDNVQSRLETLLGYTLSPTNLYTEIGKTTQCSCTDVLKTEDLLPATPTRGSIKIFPYNAKDKKWRVDPFYEVYAVKLVRVVGKGRVVTVKDFDSYLPEYSSNGIGNFIAKCTEGGCDCECSGCVQLAVAADWVDFEEKVDSVPNDLVYLLIDMTKFYGDPTRDIKSESVDGHSWTRGNTTPPEHRPEMQLLLKRYAGPYGSVVRIPVV